MYLPSVYNMIMLINIIEYGESRETASNALKRPNNKISEYRGDPKFQI